MTCVNYSRQTLGKSGSLSTNRFCNPTSQNPIPILQADSTATTYQTLQPQHAHLAELMHKVLAVKAQLAPLQQVLIGIQLLFQLARVPDGLEHLRVDVVLLGVDERDLLAVRDAHDVRLEVHAGREVLDVVQGHEALVVWSGRVRGIGEGRLKKMEGVRTTTALRTFSRSISAMNSSHLSSFACASSELMSIML